MLLGLIRARTYQTSVLVLCTRTPPNLAMGSSHTPIDGESMGVFEMPQHIQTRMRV